MKHLYAHLGHQEAHLGRLKVQLGRLETHLRRLDSRPWTPSPGNTGFCSTIPMPMQFSQILYNYNTIQYNAICLNIAYNIPQYNRLKRI